MSVFIVFIVHSLSMNICVDTIPLVTEIAVGKCSAFLINFYTLGCVYNHESRKLYVDQRDFL